MGTIRFRTPCLLILVAVFMFSFSGAPAHAFTVAVLGDEGGFEDNGFNENTLAGALRAQDTLPGVEVQAFEVAVFSGEDPVEFIENLIATDDPDLILGIGFVFGEAINQAASENSGTAFAIIDFPNFEPDVLTNLQGLVFDVMQPSFLAGYLACYNSETALVGTFGGLDIPPVTDFMVGFDKGVAYCNDVNKKSVSVLPRIFTEDFSDPASGEAAAKELIAQGADFIFPVAGATGFGAIPAVLTANAGGDGPVYIIGVDVDWYLLPLGLGQEPVMATSVLKRTDVAAYDAIARALDGDIGGNFIGTLENGQTALAPFHDYEGEVSKKLRKDLEKIERKIIQGKIDTGSP